MRVVDDVIAVRDELGIATLVAEVLTERVDLEVAYMALGESVADQVVPHQSVQVDEQEPTEHHSKPAPWRLCRRCRPP